MHRFIDFQYQSRFTIPTRNGKTVVEVEKGVLVMAELPQWDPAIDEHVLDLAEAIRAADHAIDIVTRLGARYRSITGGSLTINAVRSMLARQNVLKRLYELVPEMQQVLALRAERLKRWRGPRADAKQTVAQQPVPKVRAALEDTLPPLKFRVSTDTIRKTDCPCGKPRVRGYYCGMCAESMYGPASAKAKP